MKNDEKEFFDLFFQRAKELGYAVEKVQKGEYKGSLQVIFPNKKLHEGHLKKLYTLIKRGKFPTRKEFDRLIPGRPCAYLPAREIIKKIVL